MLMPSVINVAAPLIPGVLLDFAKTKTTALILSTPSVNKKTKLAVVVSGRNPSILVSSR